MLEFCSKLTQDFIRNIARDLSTKINSNTFRSNKFNNRFQLGQEILCSFLENEMSFIDEDDQFRSSLITHLRKFCIHFSQQAKHERRKEFRLILHIRQTHNVDVTPLSFLSEKIFHIKRFLPEKTICPLLFQFQQFPHDDSHSC